MSHVDAPPHDVDAEESLLGSMMLSPDALRAAGDAGVDASDFYKPQNATIFNAIGRLHAAGCGVDVVTLASELGDALDELGGRQTLSLIQAATPASANAAAYARTVRELARRRACMALATHLRDVAREGGDLTAVSDQLARETAPPVARIAVPDVFHFINDPSADPDDWLVDELLEALGRLLVVGGEGCGKSTLLRMLAVLVAAGIHPFTLDAIEPRRVLLVDLENPTSLLRPWVRALTIQAGDALQPDQLFVVSQPSGINVLDEEDRHWFDAHAAATDPDLIVVGPLYKLMDGDPSEEKVAKPVAAYLDRLRTRHHAGIILEHHIGNEASGSTRRPERPIGSSVWRRWPEYGLFLSEQGQLRAWRPQRGYGTWPTQLRRGGEWPFTVEHNQRAKTFAAMVEHVNQIGRIPSNRAIADALRVSDKTIGRTIKDNQNAWEAIRLELGE